MGWGWLVELRRLACIFNQPAARAVSGPALAQACLAPQACMHACMGNHNPPSRPPWHRSPCRVSYVRTHLGIVHICRLMAEAVAWLHALDVSAMGVVGREVGERGDARLCRLMWQHPLAPAERRRSCRRPALSPSACHVVGASRRDSPLPPMHSPLDPPPLRRCSCPITTSSPATFSSAR